MTTLGVDPIKLVASMAPMGVGDENKSSGNAPLRRPETSAVDDATKNDAVDAVAQLSSAAEKFAPSPTTDSAGHMEEEFPRARLAAEGASPAAAAAKAATGGTSAPLKDAAANDADTTPARSAASVAVRGSALPVIATPESAWGSASGGSAPMERYTR